MNTTLTPELIQEGLSRDITRLIQNARKTAGLQVSDHIKLGLKGDEELLAAAKAHLDTIAYEVLADEISFDKEIENAYKEKAEIEAKDIEIAIAKV